MLLGRLYVWLMSVVPARVYSSLVGVYFEMYGTVFMNLALFYQAYLDYFL